MLRNKIQDDSLNYTHVSINYVSPDDGDCNCNFTLNKYATFTYFLFCLFYSLFSN
jgi:hypothetical protein